PDDLRGRRVERDRSAVLFGYVAAADPHVALRVFERALQAGSIGSLRLPNRIVMGSMHLGIEHDARALSAFYAERARGGAGLIVTGGSAVSRAGAGGRHYSFINDPTSASVLEQAVRAVHDAGGRIALH